MDFQLKQKLFSIVQRPAKYKEHPNIIIPEKLSPIPQSQLFYHFHSFHILEFGCGWGEFAIQWLEKFPQHEYIAIEIKRDRIKRLIKKIDKKNLYQLKIIPVNYHWFLEEILPANSFDLIIINFPDPWPKRKHWKHRLIHHNFLLQSYQLLRRSGLIYIATDYGPYARKIIQLFRKSEHYIPLIPWPNYTRKRLPVFPESKFEKITSQFTRPWYTIWKKIESRTFLYKNT